jgi:hypothetical protein
MALVLSIGVLLVVGLRSAGAFLVVSDRPAPADATVLTYGVNSFARPIARRVALGEAITRYNSGHGPRVLLSDFQDDDTDFRTRIALARQFLVRGGVPDDAIEILPPVTSEYEEGLALRRAVAGREWQRIVVYAADFRSRRTAGTLRNALAGTGIEIRVVAISDPQLRLDRWWATRDGILTVLNEYPRLIYYLLLGRL